MSDVRHQFSVGDDVVLDVSVISGDIVVSESDVAGHVSVRIDGSGAESFRIEQRGDVVSVAPEKGGGMLRRFFSADVVIEAPGGSNVQLHAGSGDVIVNCPVRDCTVAIASGDVKVREVTGDATIKTASGDIFVHDVGGRLRASTASGDVRIGQVAADCAINSASGDVFCDFAGGPIEVKTASGDATFSHVGGDAVTAKTLSGTLRIGVPPARAITFDLQSLSGELRNNLTQGASDGPSKELDIRIKTVSGDVYLNDV